MSIDLVSTNQQPQAQQIDLTDFLYQS